MQSQREIEDSGVSPSFSCYSSDSLKSKAVANVIEEQLAEPFNEFGIVNEDDFEFSFEQVSHKDMDSKSWQVFPVFNRDQDVTSPLRKLFIDEELVSCSHSSSESEEADSDNELENIPSRTFCVWKPKAESGSSSPAMTKCTKSSSTGSGSKRWSIRYLLRRCNSEGKEPMVLLSSKQKQNSGEVERAVSRLKGQIPVHETFYVQRQAENEIVKRVDNSFGVEHWIIVSLGYHGRKFFPPWRQTDSLKHLIGRSLIFFFSQLIPSLHS
ncbi:hypothetical protein CTI12_AA358870 [Artemisia annua]|uniref:Uncharacterized protein n=1 Tax=Artemisia annua TaxID=35608 RepID=A0A2U1L9Q5_ARTAN|nr:hypothetical protein CTI12_AA358870 [Artemisia annua]